MFASKDRKLMEWCREAAVHLRNAICIIENLLDPETIVIGGSAPKPLVEHIVTLSKPLSGSVRAGRRRSEAASSPFATAGGKLDPRRRRAARL